MLHLGGYPAYESALIHFQKPLLEKGHFEFDLFVFLTFT